MVAASTALPVSGAGITRMVSPLEAAFSGFVFKIQANMDLAHRDRIAFFRICSGKFTRGMKVFHHRIGREIVLGAVGVLQFDVTMARLKSEYGVDASYEKIDYAAARWITCDNPKRLAEFEKRCQANLARDADGHLTYLATSEWRLGFIMEEWPDIAFRKTREHT